MLQSESFQYMLPQIWVLSERGAYGTQKEMAVMAVALHHTCLQLNLDEACIEMTHSATFCNTPDASQTHSLTLWRDTQLFVEQCSTHYLEAYNSDERTENLVRKLPDNFLH